MALQAVRCVGLQALRRCSKRLLNMTDVPNLDLAAGGANDGDGARGGGTAASSTVRSTPRPVDFDDAMNAGRVSERREPSRGKEGEVMEDPSLPPLPPDWEAIWDEAHNHFYYWNTRTDETTWYRPQVPGAEDESAGLDAGYGDPAADAAAVAEREAAAAAQQEEMKEADGADGALDASYGDPAAEAAEVAAAEEAAAEAQARLQAGAAAPVLPDDYDEGWGDEEAAAATKIQARARGRAVRQSLSGAAGASPPDEAGDVTYDAEAEAAAVRIQARARGVAARKSVTELREGRGPRQGVGSAPAGPRYGDLDEEERAAREAAAVKIQSVARGRAARKSVSDKQSSHGRARAQSAGQERSTRRSAASQEQEEAAVKVQSLARGRAARRSVASAKRRRGMPYEVHRSGGTVAVKDASLQTEFAEPPRELSVGSRRRSPKREEAAGSARASKVSPPKRKASRSRPTEAPQSISSVLRWHRKGLHVIFAFFAHSQRKVGVSDGTFDAIRKQGSTVNLAVFVKCCKDFGLLSPQLLGRDEVVAAFRAHAAAGTTPQLDEPQFCACLAACADAALRRPPYAHRYRTAAARAHAVFRRMGLEDNAALRERMKAFAGFRSSDSRGNIFASQKERAIAARSEEAEIAQRFGLPGGDTYARLSDALNQPSDPEDVSPAGGRTAAEQGLPPAPGPESDAPSGPYAGGAAVGGKVQGHGGASHAALGPRGRGSARRVGRADSGRRVAAQQGGVPSAGAVGWGAAEAGGDGVGGDKALLDQMGLSYGAAGEEVERKRRDKGLTTWKELEDMEGGGVTPTARGTAAVAPTAVVRNSGLVRGGSGKGRRGGPASRRPVATGGPSRAAASNGHPSPPQQTTTGSAAPVYYSMPPGASAPRGPGVPATTAAPAGALAGPHGGAAVHYVQLSPEQAAAYYAQGGGSFAVPHGAHIGALASGAAPVMAAPHVGNTTSPGGGDAAAAVELTPTSPGRRGRGGRGSGRGRAGGRHPRAATGGARGAPLEAAVVGPQGALVPAPAVAAASVPTSTAAAGSDTVATSALVQVPPPGWHPAPGGGFIPPGYGAHGAVPQPSAGGVVYAAYPPGVAPVYAAAPVAAPPQQAYAAANGAGSRGRRRRGEAKGDRATDDGHAPRAPAPAGVAPIVVAAPGGDASQAAWARADAVTAAPAAAPEGQHHVITRLQNQKFGAQSPSAASHPSAGGQRNRWKR